MQVGDLVWVPKSRMNVEFRFKHWKKGLVWMIPNHTSKRVWVKFNGEDEHTYARQDIYPVLR